MRSRLRVIGVQARLKRLFPDHDIYIRSNGQLRFWRISSGFQIAAVMLILAAAMGWAAMRLWPFYAPRPALTAAKPKPLTQAEIVADKLENRQNELDALALRYFGDPVSPLSDAPPQAGPLTAIEERQARFADTVAKAAAKRTADTESMIRKLGINPALLKKNEGGVGGPFVRARPDDPVALPFDPHFKRMHLALSKLDTIERAALAVPATLPTTPIVFSSPFGVRGDPFNGEAAMHQGLDITGKYGQPIVAAADGIVRVVGSEQGYGNLVIVDHGHGIETRYGHLSAFTCRPGQRITAGQQIARMGSTGRSTGTHLHFEVRVNGRAINPRPFLEASNDMLAIKARVAERATRRL